MTEAELNGIRETLANRSQIISKGYLYNCANALLAHIDAQAAEVETAKAQRDRVAQDVKLYRVENESLRDLVREARQLIGDSHPTAKTWLEKAAKV